MEGIAMTSERNPMMRILGIHDGHTATACYLEGGTIKSTLSEERLTGVKGQGGFPSKSIEYLIDKGGISLKSLDKIALVGVIKPLVSIDQYKDGRQLGCHLIRSTRKI
jgi:predicted NodU family carbamoyl transferase